MLSCRHSSCLRTSFITQMLTSASEWLTGQVIDAFMAWVIYKDLPVGSHVLDDMAAADIARCVLAGTSHLVDMADTIYMPTWLVGPLGVLNGTVAAGSSRAPSGFCFIGLYLVYLSYGQISVRFGPNIEYQCVSVTSRYEVMACLDCT